MFVMLRNLHQQGLCDQVFSNFGVVGQVQERLVDLLGHNGVAFFAFLEETADDLVVLHRLLQRRGHFNALFNGLGLDCVAEELQRQV